MTCPDETERMIKVESGQGTEDEIVRTLPRGSSFSKKSATVSGGVDAPNIVEASSGIGSRWLRTMTEDNWGGR